MGHHDGDRDLEEDMSLPRGHTPMENHHLPKPGGHPLETGAKGQLFILY